MAWLQIPAVPLVSCVNLGKSLNFPEPQFPHRIEFFCGLNKLIKVKYLRKDLVLGNTWVLTCYFHYYF